MINKSILAVVESKYFFYSILLLNIIFLCFTKFYPSIDGAAHLYNSNILLELLKGNQTLSEFYSINKLPIPNWTGHFILLTFQSFLPAWIAEKILLIFYVAGMAISFRYLIKVLNPENTSLSILIFPFIYSFLFHLGFYNFSISFIFLFTTLGFWLRNNTSTKPYFLIILFLLINITYFTNLLIFGFLGLIIGLYILYFSYKECIEKKNIQIAIKFALKKLGVLLLVSLPGLIFLLIFFNNIQFFPSNQSYTVKELLKWINDARPFIVYDYSSEEIITQQYFHVLLILLAFSFIPPANQSASKKLLNEKVNIIAIPLILTIILLFITPNGSGAGMMSDRYCLMIFIFGLILIVSRPTKIKINTIVILIFVVLHIGLIFNHYRIIKKLDKDAIAIKDTEKYISENHIVLPVNLSDNWLEPHFSNYLGINKSVIILENYEASIGWFPVKWNLETMSKILLTDKESICDIHWPSNAKSSKNKQIDFVILYGNQEKINDFKWQELRDILSTNFKIKYKSSDNYVLLYERL